MIREMEANTKNALQEMVRDLHRPCVGIVGNTVIMWGYVERRTGTAKHENIGSRAAM